MACNACMSSLFKEKLGRCKQCMLINLVMLIGFFAVYMMVDIEQWLVVQQVTFLMFFAITAILMALHLLLWCFYRLTDKY
ncbi:DUF3624 domain-containing protein [Psychromonas sp. B3M02]|uniref:DUF3624 family protein n=1 Tax=Psychromonas sp. B3M02 TaxID=2267226 RepID=UPI000DE88CCD|nr:DUF3624 family protein [Psychromonas sp. B3M02]RBW46856.1 DUF3624 domain-containing protein [Psychromonas sp. B3M02]